MQATPETPATESTTATVGGRAAGKTAATKKAKAAKPTTAKKAREKAPPKKTAAKAPKAAPAAKMESKGDAVVRMVSREKGATMDELILVTGWQKHSLRAFLSAGMRKKGLKAAERRVDAETKVATYHFAGKAEAAPVSEPAEAI